jgi:uroporphyrin-III C-methyltransferase / precorrin-2 dehydrogenase / sirohydrochlorin ferrochelatase
MPISPSQQSKRPQSSSARIGTLATLPVFFDLNGKPVLLIGGTEAATWKAELLVATGANVEVHATEFCAEMQSLAARSDLNGSIKLIEQPWSLQAFANKSLIVGDGKTVGEAKAIFCAARAAGVPVNVIDKPAYCTFKFGTIVNRSPVVIGISTDGAAPVLGQAVRTRIEAVLPDTLAQWAALARDIRALVMTKLRPGSERRAYWAKFARLCFGPYRETSAYGLLQGTLDAAQAKTGTITIIIAPDEADMLTLRDVRHLQSADLIISGPDVACSMLDHARREAVRICLSDEDIANTQFIERLRGDARLRTSHGENTVLAIAVNDARAAWVAMLLAVEPDQGISSARRTMEDTHSVNTASV